MTDATGAIVVGVDGSALALRAVRWAAAEAAPRALPLHLMFGFDATFAFHGADPTPLQRLFDRLGSYAQDQLSEAERIAHEVGPDLVVTTSQPQQRPIPALLEASKTARMIALGSSGVGGFAGMLAGSTTMAVAGRAHCPVVVVRGRADESVPAEGPVVVGVDGSRASEGAVAVAFDEAAWRGVPLVAVHSWSDADYVSTLPFEDVLMEYVPMEQESAQEEQRGLLSESLAGWQEKYPDVRVDRVVTKDRPRHHLLDWSGRAQLVIVGSRGRGGFLGLLLGSVGQALIHHAQCPVMIVHSESTEAKG
ncbi:universal stress protein [Amycolatopsis taiwanensis]|uniref:Universal stress protein n=1 Tax=Amycolatopsis taiwanensis TaxID=342230 RepID=A0A9W6VLF3_9PSEU|nr:universal stress protein [Amycolatopsis taiwanensis]GLY70461.1 universal stress protein [Amycolatopsis taiwanensis]